MLSVLRASNVRHDDLIAEEVPRTDPIGLIAIDAFVGKDLDELAARPVMSDGGRNVVADDLIDNGRIHLALL